MTDISPREAKTKEALESVMAEMTFLRDHPAEKELDDKIRIALAAYNPPPQPIPQIPAWDELSKEQKYLFVRVSAAAPCHDERGDSSWHEDVYNEIRRVTSKPA